MTTATKFATLMTEFEWEVYWTSDNAAEDILAEDIEFEFYNYYDIYFDLQRGKAEEEEMIEKELNEYVSGEEEECDTMGCECAAVHFVKRDAGIDEWTCEACFKEQYE